VVEDTELVPEFPSRLIDAITGADFTVRRVNAHGTVDTAKVFGNNVRVESSWLHDTVVFQNDPSQDGGPTHNDGVQVLGGRNIRIVGNTITGARNAGIQVTQGTGPTTDLEITRNWLDGGGCTVNLSHVDKAASMSGITVTGNRFGRHSTFAGCAIVATGATSVAATGNVWEDDGTSVGPVRRLK
jgi:hypothetical protein